MHDLDAMLLGNGYCLINFESVIDYKKVLSGCPHFVYDHYLHVEKWRPKFVAENAQIKTAVAWVRIPSLPVEYLQSEEVILGIARLIGRPIRLDRATAEGSWARFARICLELNLEQPLVARIRIDGIIRHVEYENLPIICYECDRVGYRREICPFSATPMDDAGNTQGQPKIELKPEESKSFGAWMQAVRRRRPNPQHASTGKDKRKSPVNGPANHIPSTAGQSDAKTGSEGQKPQNGTRNAIGMIADHNRVVGMEILTHREPRRPTRIGVELSRHLK